MKKAFFGLYILYYKLELCKFNVQFGRCIRELILEFELPIAFDGLGECPTVLKIVVFLRLVLVSRNSVFKISL